MENTEEVKLEVKKNVAKLMAEQITNEDAFAELKK